MLFFFANYVSHGEGLCEVRFAQIWKLENRIWNRRGLADEAVCLPLDLTRVDFEEPVLGASGDDVGEVAILWGAVQ